MGTNRLSEGTTSPHATFYLQADEISPNAATNTSTVRCYLVCAASASSSWYGYNDASVTGSVNGVAFTVSGASAAFAQGSYGWSYGPYDVPVKHDPNGSKTASLGLSVSYPNATDKGGSQAGNLVLSPLTVAPGVPTSVTLTRNSDSQATVRWTRNEATNGTATAFDVQTRVNGGAWSTVATIAAASSVVLAVSANQKIEAQVRASNAKGTSAWSSTSAPIWTTPAAPSNVTATKQADNSIIVSWTPNVGYSEHQHLIQHGVLTGGTITWDSGTFDPVAAGTTNYHHTAPSPQQVHVYRVWAKTTDVSGLVSAQVQSNSVQLLAPPNTPTVAALAAWSNPLVQTRIDWTHNPVDTTEQTKAELRYSEDGGATWTASVFSNAYPYALVGPPGSAYVGKTLQFQVRTWGQATTGGSDGTGASPWSSPVRTTYATLPVATITSPVTGSSVTEATVRVSITMAQAEGATPVRATIRLLQGSTVLETLDTTTLPSTQLATRVQDGATYQLQVTVLDSHGMTSAQVSSTFTVDYTDPVAAACVVTYLPDSGMAQLDLTIPTPGTGQSVATALTITRTIAGKTETILDHAPISEAAFSVLDTTPAINTANRYTITTWSADGAATSVTVAKWGMGSQGLVNLESEPLPDGGGWVAASNISYRSEIAQDGPLQGLSWRRWVFTSSGSSTQLNGGPNYPLTPTIPGRTYAVSAFFASSISWKSVGLFVRWTTTSGAWVYKQVNGVTSTVAGQWTRITGVVVAPPDVVGCIEYIHFLNTDVSADDWCGATGFMVTEGSVVHDYFDGSFPDAIWTGEEHNSPSQMRGPTDERWAFLNAGPGYADFVNFYGNLVLGSTPMRDQALIQTAGRDRPIALYGASATFDVTVTATIVTGDGSTVEQIEQFFLTAGRTCYRDPSGRRIFGLVKGQIQNRTWGKADLAVTVSEAY